MKSKTKGIIAGVAGVALLTGGSTFALWSAQDSIAGGTIVNGDLDVQAAEALSWIDASDDRDDAGHVIDLATWKMVPGDTAQGTQTVQVKLVGDNLAAELDLRSTEPADLNGLVLEYDVYAGDPATTAPVASGTYGEPVELRFAANATSQEATTPTTVVVGADGTTTLTVVVTATFTDTGAGQARDDVTASTALGNVGVSLTQVRTGAGFTS